MDGYVGGVGPAGGFQVNQGPGLGSISLNSANAGQVILETLIGTIDSLTLTDNGTTDNAVNVTWSDTWAESVGSFPVTMALLNNDPTTPDAAGLATGGVNFVGVAENDSGFNITASANNDTIWGGQLNDVINAGAGNDFVNADPAVGIVVAPGTQMVKTLTFDLTQTIEAGDRVAVSVGGRTYTWTATADAVNLGATGALAALRDAINNGGATGGVTESGNIDDGADEDDVTASVSGSVMTLVGTGLDTNFGYALGENHTVATALTAINPMNRPTAIVDLAGVGVPDTGDVVTINVNGTLYSATVGAGSGFGGINGILDTAAELAASLANTVNGGSLMTAEASGTQVTLRGNTASTTYTINPSWTTDLLPAGPTARTVTTTFSASAGATRCRSPSPAA